MRILYFTQLFYPALFGGGEYIFYQWAADLANKGHEVHVITQNLDGAKSYENHRGMHIYRVGSTLNPTGTLPIGIISNLTFLVRSFFLGVKVSRKSKIDVIHSNTYVPVLSAQLCSSLLQIPHIATIHDVYRTSQKDFWKTWSNQTGVSKSMAFLGPLMEKLVTKMPVSTFHTVSEKSKQDLESLGVSKVVVIPNGINPDDYQVSGTAKKNQAIFIGRLVFYKNLDVLINAFAKIIEKIPDARLVIVGNGPQRNHLEQLVESLGLKNSISFTGMISDAEKIRLISESKVLLNPSLVEGFGIVVLEGFACGKPVITSDSKPLSDLIDDGLDGYVIPATDTNSWAEKIIELLSDGSKCTKMGMQGKKKVAEKYSISKLGDDMASLYKQVIK
ncbi:Putative glycosyltransferase, cell wall synthesis-related [Nitrosotalea devaniterrae]|uniref:Glycosyltransferase, cell wall synthesis-related n=1 Tax=Nitrosotalea devaniterrae TaxID=1078905 RepID=A0A128A0Q6_9ARCH|nr:Putative glycosyltransferase, cell wall synthesis-related [Candidatus Nitrosotalea devanaterra]